MKVYTKDATYPAMVTIPDQGTVGNAIGSTYNAGVLDYTWGIISLFQTMEADPDVIAQDMLIPLETTGALYEAFNSASLTDYKATPVWFSGLSAADVNIEVATAKRRYKLQAQNAANLYMEVEIGISGLGNVSNSSINVHRPYVKVIFSAEEAFTTLVGEHSFSVKNYQNTAIYNTLSATPVKMRYIVHKGVLAIYPHNLHIHSKDAHVLGKRSDYTAPYLFPLGLVISIGDYYAPLSANGKSIFAICSPEYVNYNGSPDATSNTISQFGFSAAKCRGSSIFTNINTEKRGFFSPSVSGGAIASNNPARNYIAPFTHIFGNGTILTSPDLVYVSDPDRSRVDFVTSNLLYNGESTDFTILPMMMSHPTVNLEWIAPSFSFQLGIKV